MKIGWRFRAAFLLAKNEDLVSSQIAARILRFDNVRFYLVLLVFQVGGSVCCIHACYCWAGGFRRS